MWNAILVIHALFTLCTPLFTSGLCGQWDCSGLRKENAKKPSLRISVHEREPHLFSNGKLANISHWELQAKRDMTKANYLFHNNNNISIANRILKGDYIYPIEEAHNSGIYYSTINLGTPPQPLQLILDTGSSLVWTQSNPCIDCYRSNVPKFFSYKSSSYNPLSCQDPYCIKKGLLPQRKCEKDSSSINSGKCEYYLEYGLGVESTSGVVAYETLTITSPDDHDHILLYKNFVFGAGDFQTGQFTDDTSGILGLGRSEFSFITQLEVDGVFGMCLPQIMGANKKKPGYLLLGEVALQGIPSMRSITISYNPSYPDFYYLTIVNIYVNNVLLHIPVTAFQIANGNGGTFIDTGTTFTTLVEAAFNPLISELKRQIMYPIIQASYSSFELCFDITGAQNPIVPSITMEFDNSVAWTFGTHQTFGFLYDQKNSNRYLMCLAMTRARHTNILGVFQLGGSYIAYDLPHHKLYFEPRDCS